MPIAGDVVRWCVKGTVLNREFYVCLDWRVIVYPSGISLENYADAYSTDLVTPMMANLNEVAVATELQLENLTNTSEFWREDIDIAGTDTSAPAPAFVAYGGLKVRTTKVTRSGGVRLPGASDGAIDDEGLISTGKASALEAAMPAYLVMTVGAQDIEQQMVIVGRNVDGSLDLARVNPVSGVQFRYSTTQNSRKRYKGR